MTNLVTLALVVVLPLVCIGVTAGVVAMIPSNPAWGVVGSVLLAIIAYRMTGLLRYFRAASTARRAKDAAPPDYLRIHSYGATATMGLAAVGAAILVVVTLSRLLSQGG